MGLAAGRDGGPLFRFFWRMHLPADGAGRAADVAVGGRQVDLAAGLEAAVAVLFELEGQTSIEIGTMLDIPTGTATSRLRRAREHFQTHAARLTGTSRSQS